MEASFRPPSPASMTISRLASRICGLRSRNAGTRTTNLLERLFGEERRRTKVIPHAFGERAVLKLMFAALIRASQSWLRVSISEFEQRQLAELRQLLLSERKSAPVMPGKIRGFPAFNFQQI